MVAVSNGTGDLVPSDNSILAVSIIVVGDELLRREVVYRGLMLLTKCYGIVGFIKFLEPYYMILITK